VSQNPKEVEQLKVANLCVDQGKLEAAFIAHERSEPLDIRKGDLLRSRAYF